MTETLLANIEERTVKGMLLPYNEESRNSNVGVIEFSKGTVTIPSDPAVVTANLRHNREEPVGRATELADTEDGIVATFAIAKTPEGDALLQDVSEGRLTRLSAEVKGITRRGVKALTGALFGAAFVDEGAFKSAALYAELVEETHSDDTYTDSKGQTWRRVYDSTTDKEETTEEDGSETVTYKTETTVTETAPAPAEEETPSETMEAKMADEAKPEETTTSVVPQTLMAGAVQAQTRTTLREVTNALANFHAGNDASAFDNISDKDGSTLFAALNDVKATTGGSVGVAVIQPQWVGDVWNARTYERKITPLLSSNALTSLKIQGFKFTTAPAGDVWSGDKANVPTNTPATTGVTTTATRWAGGHDIAREYVDFSVPEFWDSYYKYMANSYSAYTDTAALATLTGGATPVTGGSVPSGINVATVSLVDGAISVLEAGGTPTFAIVAPDVYRDLLLQGKDDILATLSLATGLESAEFAGFRVISNSGVAATKALVGDRAAATFYELPGVPIRTTALDQVKGGVDEVAFGYFATVINNAGALALVTPDDGGE